MAERAGNFVKVVLGARLQPLHATHACMLSAPQIEKAFGALSKELEGIGQAGEIVVVGGAALVLLFGARETTKDVDAMFIHPEASTIRTAAKRVAALLDLPDDWLNDAAKGFMVGVTTGEVVHRSVGLVVTTASVEQLLAMKLAAWRDAIDRADARLLLENLKGIAEADLWARLEPLVPPPQLDKASYAFQDLWESVHGSS